MSRPATQHTCLPCWHRQERATYPAYRPSGVVWLGEIPKHWDAKRLRFLVSEPLKYGANESAELDDPDLPRYIRITDVDENGRLRDETFKSLPEDVARPYLLKDGDLLLARSGATVGKSFYYEPSWGRAAYAGYLIRARFNPARVMPRFVNYFTNSQQYWQWLGSSFIQATIQNVSAEKYANLIIPVPPFDDQAQIVAHLDSETARIDALIEKKQRQIELLQEKRSALISHTVTKGLDPKAPMKDSGIEWLGEIPGHWEVRPIRSLAKQGYKTFTDGDWIESPFIRDVGIRLIQTGNIGVGIYKEQGFRYIDEKTFYDIRCTEVRPGDVLICRLADPVGRACIAPDLGCRMITSVDVCILKTSADTNPAFAVYALSSAGYLAWLGGICRGGTRDRVSRSMLGSIRIQLPPLLEQRAIAAFLDRETGRIDTLIEKVQESITMLREYRIALISAAVTGKIDVRKEVQNE